MMVVMESVHTHTEKAGQVRQDSRLFDSLDLRADARIVLMEALATGDERTAYFALRVVAYLVQHEAIPLPRSRPRP